MKARILYVDDLEIWRNIVKDILGETYHVDTTASLQQALSLLKNSEPYQLVITDIGLSEDATNTDGLDVLKAVRRLSPRTQTIAISGRPATVDEESFRAKYGALAYLERDVLYDNLDLFLAWVAKGIALAQANQGE